MSSSWTTVSRLEQEVNALHQERNQIHNENYTLRLQANEQYLRISALENQINDYQTIHDRQLEIIDEKNGAVAALHAQAQIEQESHDAEIGQLQDVHTNEISELQESVEELRAQNDLLLEDVKFNDEMIIQLQGKLATIQKNAAALERENKDLRGAPVVYDFEIFYYDPKEKKYNKIGKLRSLKAIDFNTLDDINFAARAAIRTKFSIMKTNLKTAILVQSPIMRGDLYQIETEEFEDWVAAVRGAGHEKVNAKCRYVVYREEDRDNASTGLVEFKIRELCDPNL